MEKVLDVNRILGGIETGCADLRQAFDILEDEIEGLAKHAGLFGGDAEESAGEDCAIDALLDAMPEVTPEHRAELREAFQLMEDERDLALARAEAAEKQAEDVARRMEAMEKKHGF